MTSVEVEKGILALKWKDMRNVVMLSTIHNHSTVPKRRRSRPAVGGTEEIQKPVDKGDQLMSYYGFSHRTVKWGRRALFHLLDNAIVNAWCILYHLSEQPGRKLAHKQFRIELASNCLGVVTTRSTVLASVSALSLQWLD